MTSGKVIGSDYHKVTELQDKIQSMWGGKAAHRQETVRPATAGGRVRHVGTWSDSPLQRRGSGRGCNLGYKRGISGVTSYFFIFPY